jgi:transposase
MDQAVYTLGIDIGKTWFHLIGTNRAGKPIYKRKLSRAQLLPNVSQLAPGLIAMEACAGSQYLARAMIDQGLAVKLIAPQFVKPYVPSQKNDFNDAAAIAEAARRPTMRFVPVKSQEQLDLQALHRYRERLVHDRTAMTNQIRGFLLENGITVAKGRPALRDALPALLEDAENALSPALRRILDRLQHRWRVIEEAIGEVDRQIKVIAANRDDCRRLLTIPGIGPLSATAFIAAIGNGSEFKNGRTVAAWLGLVPRQHSTGGQQRLLGITKRGNPYLRRLLIHGARSVILHTDRERHRLGVWVNQLESRAHRNVAVVALANKLARMSWAVLTQQTIYRPQGA